MEEILNRLRSIVIDVVNLHGEQPIEPAQVTATADFYEELGMDSLMAVALFVEIQRTFRVKLSEEQMPELRSLEQVASHILERANGPSIAGRF
jgi:acyl carrier protein